MSLILPTHGSFVDPQCPVAWEHPLNRGLVNWFSGLPNSGWRGGSKVRDLIRGSKNPSDVTLTNTPTWLKGVQNGGLPSVLFNGSSQYGQCSLNLSAYSTISVSTWIYVVANVGSYDIYFEFTADGQANAGGFHVYRDNSVGLVIGCRGNVGTSVGYTAALSIGSWHHLLAIYDFTLSTNEVNLYVDGALRSLTRNANSDNTGVFANSTLNFAARNASSLYANIRMSDTKIYNRSIPANQVQALYREGQRGNPETLRWVGNKVYSFPFWTATRFYLSSSERAPANSPGFAAWTRTSEAVRRRMRTTKDNTTMLPKTVFGNEAIAGNTSALAVQFSSPPMTVGTKFAITDRAKCQIRAAESTTNDNITRLVSCIKIYNGTTLQATLLALGLNDRGVGELVAGTPTNRVAVWDKELAEYGSTYTTVSGDYLVVELGAQVDAGGGTTVVGSLSFGSNASTDLPENSTETLALNPWIEFTNTITFAPAPSPGYRSAFGWMLGGLSAAPTLSPAFSNAFSFDFDIGPQTARTVGTVSSLMPMGTPGQLYGTFTHVTPLVLICEVGAYNLTGVDAALTAGHAVVPDVGGYTLTGVDPTLTVTRVLAPDVGSYVLTGVDVALTLSRILAADVGSYILTGVTTSLAYGHVLATDVGSYALTGIDPAVLYGHAVTPDVGAYNLTGVDPGITQGHAIAPDVGTYNLTGVDPTVLFGYVVAFDAGTYNLTGVDPATLYGRAIAADIGSYGLTGVDPTLERTTILALDIGSYNLSGVDAALLRSFYVAPDIGSYILTGIDSALTVAKLLDADIGAYNLTGVDSALIFAHVLDGDVGSYTLTGVAAALLHAHILDTDVGAYNLTGVDPALLRGFSLSSDTGTYTLTGVDPSLEFGHALNPDVGSYNLTGVDVDLVFEAPGAFTLSCDTGTYVITGIAAALTTARSLTPDVGSYAVSGVDPALTQNYALIPDTGVYTLTGNALGLTKQNLIQLDVGSYAITGVNVDLLRGAVITANVGAYSLTGVNADLTRARILSVDTGVYTSTGINLALTVGKTLFADVGSYALTGQDLNFDRLYVLNTAVGSYVLVGAVLTMTHGGIIDPAIKIYEISSINRVAYAIEQNGRAEREVSTVNRIMADL